MRNFHEIPQALEKDYGLFLIRRTNKLTADVLDQLHTLMIKEGFMISFERLFKGSESSLAMFAPRKIIQNYLLQLDLLEIEDYTDVAKMGILGFEMGTKSYNKNDRNLQNFFGNFPKLEDDETLWWQLVVMAKGEGIFEVVPRVIIKGGDQVRSAEIEKKLHHLAGGFLTKIPKPYSSLQILQFYKQRNLGKDKHNPTITSNEVLNLILLR